MKGLYVIFIMMSLNSCGVHQLVIPNLDMAVHRLFRLEMDLNRDQQKSLNQDVDNLLNETRVDVKNAMGTSNSSLKHTSSEQANLPATGTSLH